MQIPPFIATNLLHLGHTSASDVSWVILSSEFSDGFKITDDTCRISHSSESDNLESSVGCNT